MACLVIDNKEIQIEIDISFCTLGIIVSYNMTCKILDYLFMKLNQQTALFYDVHQIEYTKNYK